MFQKHIEILHNLDIIWIENKNMKEGIQMSRRKPDAKAWSLKQFNTMIQKGTILFDHPLQRPKGQWKIEDKSLLIDSLLTLYCPDIFAIKEKTENGNTYSIIDGLQRMSTIFEYLADGFALTELPDFTLESAGDEVYNISGKKFSELPEEVQNEITSYMLGIKAFEIEDGDDEEAIVEEIFYRLNNGKGMSKEHKALVRASHKVQKFVHKMATEHKLFTEVAKFSEGAIKKSDVQMTILQSILIVSGLDFTSFAAKDIEQVVSENEITDQVLEITEKSFDAILKAFPEKHKFVTKINISSMVYLFANSLDHEDTTNKLLTYANGKPLPADEYKKFTGAGNVKKPNVLGRMKGILSVCGVEERELIVKEETQSNIETNEEDQPKTNQETPESTTTTTPEEFSEESTNDYREEAQAILDIVSLNVAS